MPSRPSGAAKKQQTAEKNEGSSRPGLNGRLVHRAESRTRRHAKPLIFGPKVAEIGKSHVKPGTDDSLFLADPARSRQAPLSRQAPHGVQTRRHEVRHFRP